MIKNIALIGTIGVLLTSCGGDSEAKTEEPVNVEVKSVGELTFAYYDQDSIATQFNFYVETQTALEAKKKKIDAKVAVQQKAYESAGIALQNGMQSNILSQNQAEAYQRKMAQCEQEMMRIQQNELVPFEKESFEANTVLMNKIDAYSKAFAEKNGLKLFFTKAIGGQVAYVDPQFNMTTEFIDFMNKKEEDLNIDTQE